MHNVRWTEVSEMRYALIGLLCATALVACSERTNDNECLVGSWLAEDVEVSDAGDTESPWYLVTKTYTFRTDASYATDGVYRRMEELSVASNVGTFAVEGNELVLSFGPAGRNEFAASFECHGNVLTIHDHRMGTAIEMKRTDENKDAI